MDAVKKRGRPERTHTVLAVFYAFVLRATLGCFALGIALLWLLPSGQGKTLANYLWQGGLWLLLCLFPVRSVYLSRTFLGGRQWRAGLACLGSLVLWLLLVAHYLGLL